MKPKEASLTPAQANRAAEILRAATREYPLDVALRDFFSSHRYLRDLERRELARVVFAHCRWRRWTDEKTPLQAQVSVAFAAQLRFERDRSAFKPEALSARAAPDWLRDEMDVTSAMAQQWQREPRLWIRARARHADRVVQDLAPDVARAVDTVQALIPFLGAGSEAGVRFARTALLYSGGIDLHRTEAFRSGWFEIQDLASQLVGLACSPKPGETWWDACAGEGGKTLHLADLMEGKGLIWASDRSARRLASLKVRAARAEAFNYRAASWDGSPHRPTRTRFDGILVDAPCSGVGTWQRNPHARWTTTPNDVRELAEVQRRLLENAVPALKPGGRLIYSVCTLTRSETSTLVADFASAHPELEAIPAFPGAPASGCVLAPEALEANGMFVAVFRARP